jgi:cytoskeletal protein RodZ
MLGCEERQSESDMAEMKEPGDRRNAEPERVAVYDQPTQTAAPVNTTGTTGVAKGTGSGLPMGWIIPAVIVVLVILAILWWS